MRSVKALTAAVLLAASGLAASEPAASPAVQLEDAVAWFERMREAVHNQDYEGRFVYQVGSELQAMYVVHRVTGEHELERLVSLNGEQKQVIRGDRAVACLEPGRHHISVLEGVTAPLSGADVSLAELQQFYRFTLQAGHRVAGRDARLLKVEPLDALRFGYEISVDELTGLPLRTVMFDPKGEQQSQLLFVDLKTGESVPPIEHDLSALQLATHDRITVAADMSDPAASEWHFHDLPPGFRLRSYRAGERQHFIFSDGLASLSLYVEALDREGGFQGSSRLGATRAVGMQRHGQQITAVGEVPEQTLLLMVEAIQPK